MEAMMGNETSTGAEEVVEPTMEQIAGEAEVVETVPEPVEAQATGEESPPSVDEPSDPAQDAIQKRINKITAEKYEQKRRADELEAKLKEQEAAKQPLPVDAPQLEDFEYDDAKYQAALVQYEVQKALQAKEEAARQQQAEQARQQVAAEFTRKESEYLAEHPEYANEVANLPFFNPETLNAIYELGPKVSHYLAKNLDVANEIAIASPIMAAVKLGQISTGLSADTKKVKPSTAPEPVKTIAGGATVTKSPEDMSMDEIMALP